MLTETEKAVVFENLKGLAAVFESDKTPQVLRMYVESLCENNLQDILKTIKWAISNCKFFPRPAELLERINPKASREDADYLAGRAIWAINQFGIYRGKEAKLSIGPEAWNAVIMIGGWSTLCNTSPSELGTLRAQLRNNCMASINKEEIIDREQKRISSRNNLLSVVQSLSNNATEENKEPEIKDDYANQLQAFEIKKSEAARLFREYLESIDD